MAALSDVNPTYLDWAKRLGPDGNIDMIVEIMNEMMPVMEDQVVLEANQALSHRTTVRSGLPNGAWRKLNYGVPPEKSTTKQITDTIGSLETYAEVDKDLADLNGNSAAWRLSEESAFIEGLTQTMTETLLDGNTDTDPEKFMGFNERFNDTSAENGRMIVQSSNNTGSASASIWGIVWDSRSAHGIFPKGSSAGLKHEDLGQETLTDSNTPTGMYEGYRSHYQWKHGLSVRDWRQICRVQVIAGDLSANGGADKILDLLVDAYNNLQAPNRGRLVFYTTREIKTALDIEAVNKTNMALAQQQQDNGGPVTTFWGYPIKHLETLSSYGEAAVS